MWLYLSELLFQITYFIYVVAPRYAQNRVPSLSGDEVQYPALYHLHLLLQTHVCYILLLPKHIILFLSLTISQIKYISPTLVCYHNCFSHVCYSFWDHSTLVTFQFKRVQSIIHFFSWVSTDTQELKASKDWMKISVNLESYNQWKCPSATNTELKTSQRKENQEDWLLADLPKVWKPLRWNPATSELKGKMVFNPNGVQIETLMRVWADAYRKRG